ncbi:MAG: hypothetical protein LBQ90_04535 [Synergistaceae bacterium]|jgi:chromosome segregation ATPase|nr:hypothetical protein [Synergistaceae bacterium]
MQSASGPAPGGDGGEKRRWFQYTEPSIPSPSIPFEERAWGENANSLEKLKKESDDIGRDVADRGKIAEELRLEIEAKTKEKNSMDDEIKSLEGQIDAINGEIADRKEDLSRRGEEYDALKEKKKKICDRKDGLEDSFRRLAAECEKDCSEFSDAVDELNARYNIDREILEYYQNDFTEPVEKLIENAQEAIRKLEEHIKFLVLARQGKIKAIEKKSSASTS